MTKITCAQCGKTIKTEYAIRVSDLVSGGGEWIHENRECAFEWLEEQCKVVETMLIKGDDEVDEE